ncbi:MAG: hypothetical protein A3C44_06805 [Gammaproteobacteria bacterium RIFCSPHIGHO2_02_FULL_39_13]|nr:MAG: hypothetical protein A3C44_06805 [Gammaproteobacteria bacterium RIFCSPHIGHO2_02_FULL_39_13]OGT48143.1 MAG: hypothetical protein A3E53_03015 [Gammaproteobacteria bacterium RIFCSPHIGHO2_12_FULL_39_24]
MCYKNRMKNTVYHNILYPLLNRLDYIRLSPKTILTVGWYWEEASENLQKRYPLATIQYCGELTALNAQPNYSVDLIIAYFPVEWVSSFSEIVPLFEKLNQRLCDDGLLLFVDLGPDTFQELRKSFSAVDSFSHVFPFLDMHHMGDWLQGLHFAEPVVDREEMIVTYDDPNLFFNDLQELHFSHRDVTRRKSVMTPRQWKKMVTQYEHFKTENYFPVTVEIIFGHGWKVKLNEKNKDEVIIPLSEIRRK